MLFFSGTQILCGYIHDTICVNIKGNFNLRYASSCWRNTIQTELAESLVIPCKLSLTLYHMDIHGSLIICCSREYLALLCRDRGISLNQFRCHTAQCLDGQGQRSNIQKQDVACAGIASQFTALDAGADSHTLIRI